MNRAEAQRERRRAKRQAPKLAKLGRFRVLVRGFAVGFGPQEMVNGLGSWSEATLPGNETLVLGSDSFEGAPFSLLFLHGDLIVAQAFEAMLAILETPEKAREARERVTKTIAERDKSADVGTLAEGLPALVEQVLEDIAPHFPEGALVHSSLGVDGKAAALFLGLGKATTRVVRMMHESIVPTTENKSTAPHLPATG